MNILGKGSKLYSILKFKCPRCHEGEVFVSQNPYKLSKMFEMHEHCSHCGLRFMIEPAFFFGAMYVSYGLTVALGVATFILAHIFFDPGVWEVVAALTAVLFLGSPLILRLSRITWMNLFIKYEPEKRGPKLK